MISSEYLNAELTLQQLSDTSRSFVKRSHSDEHRRNIVHQILLPILKIVPPLSVCEFFVANIVQIIEVMKQDPSRTSDAEIRRDFIERECAYALIHILYMRLPADMVNTKESRIVEAFTKGKAANGKELTVEVFKTANTAKFKQDSVRLCLAVTVEYLAIVCSLLANSEIPVLF